MVVCVCVVKIHDQSTTTNVVVLVVEVVKADENWNVVPTVYSVCRKRERERDSEKTIQMSNL